MNNKPEDKFDAALIKCGWHQYYSKTHYVHPRIFEYLDKHSNGYYGSDYTNFQYSFEEATEINKFLNKPISI